MTVKAIKWLLTLILFTRRVKFHTISFNASNNLKYLNYWFCNELLICQNRWRNPSFKSIQTVILIRYFHCKWCIYRDPCIKYLVTNYKEFRLYQTNSRTGRIYNGTTFAFWLLDVFAFVQRINYKMGCSGKGFIDSPLLNIAVNHVPVT